MVRLSDQAVILALHNPPQLLLLLRHAEHHPALLTRLRQVVVDFLFYFVKLSNFYPRPMPFLDDERSAMNAAMRIKICQRPHTPWNQLMTTECQSSVYGKKMNPSTGIIQLPNTPENHCENNHNKTMAKRGSNNPTRRMSTMG